MYWPISLGNPKLKAQLDLEFQIYPMLGVWVTGSPRFSLFQL